MAEQVDAQDLKSCGPKGPYGFDSRLGYKLNINSLANQQVAGDFFSLRCLFRAGIKFIGISFRKFIFYGKGKKVCYKNHYHP